LTQGFFDAALREADQGYRETEGRDLLWSWKFRILKAEMYLRQGSPQKSVELLAEDPPPNLPLEVSARRRIVQGEALCRLNRPREAEGAIHDVESRLPSTRRDLQAELAFTRGRCSLPGNRAAAMQYYRTAADLAHGGDAFVEASSLINMGLLLLQDERYDEAIDKFNEVLALSDSPFIKEKALGNLGFAYSQLGDWNRATAFSQQAESLAAEITNIGDQEKWLIDLGLEHLTQLEYSQAEASYSRALALARQLPNNTDDVANSLHHLTHLSLRTHDVDKAEGYARQARTLDLEGRRRLYLVLDEAEIAKARGDFLHAEALLKPMLLNPTGTQLLRWQMESDLADIYVAQEKFAQAEEMLREAARTAVESRAAVNEKYRISFLDQVPFYDRYVRFLVSRKRNADALRIAELGRSPTLAEALDPSGHERAVTISLPHIQSTLKRRHQIVLAYWLAERESYLWVMTPSQMELFVLPAETEIQAALESYKKQILDHRDIGDTRAGQKLYEMLVRPAEKLVPKGSDVIIVPHRKLYDFNFETLIVPGPQPHYWIEDVGIQNAGFLAALANPGRMRPSSGKDLLLVGAPLEADPDFPTLKHAAEEMKRVGSHFADSNEKVIAGADAVPQAYASSKPDQFRYVHFVTHGTANVEKPLESAIILSRDSGRAYKLYARDIMATSQHAELVTISACYSAGARAFSGEGLVGLAWAFMRAGAHQVVAALWEVDDASSPQLMDDFYGELSKGKSAAEALRTAKLKMLHSTGFYRRPYYWASLQLYTGS
jgi:CHAT domain-containing protein/Tfp pilus assembly protein PilF